MRKIFCTVLMLAIFLTSTVAMAAYKEDVTEGADIASIKRLAIALPQHYKVEDTEPSLEEFEQIIFNASKAARCYVISYDEIAANIKRDTGVDIKNLQDLDARKTYNDNIAKYADAFVTVTTANNSKKIQFFFEVQDAKNAELVYLLTTMSSDFGKNLKGYTKACEDFYKKFDAAAEKNLKEQQKKNK